MLSVNRKIAYKKWCLPKCLVLLRYSHRGSLNWFGGKDRIKIGIDKIKALFKEFGGTSVYFPTEKMIYKDARDREIISQYNGFNHKELAAKYNMSESYIRAIINRHKKSA